MKFKYLNNYIIIGVGILILSQQEFFTNLALFIGCISVGGIVSLIGVIKYFKERKRNNDW
jgi:hypothetical protein